MNFEGVYRIRFANSRDVLIINSDTRRSMYWQHHDGHFFLHLAHQTRISQCAVGEPLGIIARTYGGALPSGVVASIEPSYHPEYAPDAPILFGPSADDAPLTEDEIADLLETFGPRDEPQIGVS